MEGDRKYWSAYDERYKTAHRKGVSWASEKSTPIVMDVIQRYRIRPDQKLLEIGCGEGRDAREVLEKGYGLLAADCSEEAISWCRNRMKEYARHFRVLDILRDDFEGQFDLIYAVAVIHMLVRDEDRNGFYRFIHRHLSPEGIALLCSMGDGEREYRSEISEAFERKERDHESGKMMVPATSCRMVSFRTFEKELIENDLILLEKGITEALPDFSSLMYAVIRKKKR